MANVLIIGSGGREHTLAWKLAQSPQVNQVYVAPGNGGTQWDAHGHFAACENVAIAVTNFDELITFARGHDIDLTVVGPEIPLAAGIVDQFQAADLRIFGPVAAAAQIEASKAYSKDFMTQQGIPTGEYFVTDNETAARRYLEEYHKPVVIKADGLAAGKGVMVCDTREEANQAIHTMLSDHAFGAAGDVILIEERLTGREISVLAFADGQTVKPMIVARDHKRALDGDGGLNTGGMGAIAPSPDVNQALIDAVTEQVLQPIIDGMAALGTPYIGVLYAGLMLTDTGFKTLEFNCRFGDPETQVVLPLLQTDLYDILNACIDGKLGETDIHWSGQTAVTVVIASGGYPETYTKGYTITGLDTPAPPDVVIFHAGTRATDEGIVTDGGRVLNVTALANDLQNALQRAYQTIPNIHFPNMHYRTDIGRTNPEANS